MHHIRLIDLYNESLGPSLTLLYISIPCILTIFYNSKDTWEPEEHLAECPELVSEYSSHPNELPSSDDGILLGGENQENEDPEDDTPRVGFQRGLEPYKILGATSVGGDFGFLIKWKGKII